MFMFDCPVMVTLVYGYNVKVNCLVAIAVIEVMSREDLMLKVSLKYVCYQVWSMSW